MLRPVNLRTDLAPLADLIELVFADSMDANGRAALREMRSLSRTGMGLPLFSRLNEMVWGIGMGVVWVEGGHLVGNVSIYPARLPKGQPNTWIIANVGVHPLYQRRGIAKRLMLAAMQSIQRRGGQAAVLQVDDFNVGAQQLYRHLGFVTERTFRTYKRLPLARVASLNYDAPLYVRRRRRGEWREELRLAQRLRPPHLGGLGWLRPSVPASFRPDLWAGLGDWMNFRQTDHYVIAPDGAGLDAALWVERSFGLSTRLLLMVDAAHPFADLHADTLLTLAARQSGGGTLLLEHPADDEWIFPVLDRLHFVPQRSVMHMRWPAHPPHTVVD